MKLIKFLLLLSAVCLFPLSAYSYGGGPLMTYALGYDITSKRIYVFIADESESGASPLIEYFDVSGDNHNKLATYMETDREEIYDVDVKKARGILRDRGVILKPLVEQTTGDAQLYFDSERIDDRVFNCTETEIRRYARYANKLYVNALGLAGTAEVTSYNEGKASVHKFYMAPELNAGLAIIDYIGQFPDCRAVPERTLDPLLLTP